VSEPERTARAAGGEIGAAALVLVVATAVLFRHALFTDAVFFSRDIEPYFYPMKAFLARTVRAGQVPLWNPWTVNGEPFFAALQPGLLYPGSLLLYLLPLPFAFNLLIVVHFPLAGLGLYLLVRRWGIGHAAGVLGALAFMLGGYFVSIGNFPNNLQTVAWLPWMWWSWDRFLTGRGVRDLLLFALLCAVAFLGGEPEMLALAAGLALLHGALRVERRRVPLGRQVAAMLAGALLAAAIVAVQLLPFLELVRHSIRTTALDVDFASFRAMEPSGLIKLLLPPALKVGRFGFSTHLFPSAGVPWLLSVYPGVTVLALVAGSGGGKGGRRRILFWGIAGLTGLVLALGTATPVFPALFRWLPPLRMVRYPEKFVFMTAVGVAVLAAGGADAFLAGDRPARRRIAVTASGIAALLTAAALVLRLDPGIVERACRGLLSGVLLCGRPGLAAALYGGIALRSAALLAALLGVALAVGKEAVSRAVTVAALIVLVATDLGVAHDRVNPTADADVVRTPPWAARALERLDPDVQGYRYRGSTTAASMGSAVMVPGAWEMSNMYLDYQTMGPNTGMLWGHLTQDGLQGVEMASVSAGIAFMLHNEPAVRLRLMRLSNVRYYGDATATADSLPGLSLAAQGAELPIQIYRVQGALPRAYVVGRDTVIADPERATAAALASDFPMERSVVLDRRPPGRIAPDVQGEVVAAHYGLDQVRLTIQADGPALLVLTDRWYPGWKATVRGHPAAVLRANGLFRAVAIPEGRSEVVFSFRPGSVRTGGWISLAGLVVWVSLLGLSWTGLEV
jgi:hypothetical protein